MPPNEYPPEFPRDAVELVRSSGKTIAPVAKELGLNCETARCWIRWEEADRGERSDLLSTAERQALARLRRDNAELRMERQILKAAAAGGEALATAATQGHGRRGRRRGAAPARALDVPQRRCAGPGVRGGPAGARSSSGLPI